MAATVAMLGSVVSSLLVLFLSLGVHSDEVAKLIYEDLKNVVPCVLLTNATHQIGCTSSIGGHVGVIHFVKSQDDIDWLLNKGTHAPYIPLFTSDMFNEKSIKDLADKKVINGALVIFIGEDGEAPEEGFSPDYTCPNEAFGMYSQDKTEYQGCSKIKWNKKGNGMSFMSYGIPIFAMYNQSEVDSLIQCYQENNSPNSSVPDYPLCAVQLKDFMFAAKDTPTCIRKSNIPNPTQNQFCDPLGDYNVWGTLYPATKPPQKGEIVLAAAKLDSSSFFHDLVHGADNDASGVIALLAAAKALGDAKRRPGAVPPKKPIMFALFQGESWDYIGSSRMVYEMENNSFPPNSWKVASENSNEEHSFRIKTQDIGYFLELNQVGLGGDVLWAHSDPLSRKTSKVDKEVKKMIQILQNSTTNLTISDPSSQKKQPLPPASFQRFLMKNKNIPGVVLTDHKAEFENKYYNSRFDDPFYVQGNFSKVENTSKIFLSNNFTQKLTRVASAVANTLYTLANDGIPPEKRLEADPYLVGHLVYCSFFRGNCPQHVEVFSTEAGKRLPATPMSRYVSVNTANDTLTMVTHHLLLYFTGYYLSPSAHCDSNGANVLKKMRGNGSQSGDICVNGSVYYSKAESPAFFLEEYDSKIYSTWAESTWNADLSVRMFLVASPESQIVALMSGIVITLFSFGLVFLIHRKADELFTPHDPGTSSSTE